MLGCTDLPIVLLNELCPPPPQPKQPKRLRSIPSVRCKSCLKSFPPAQWERLSNHKCTSQVITVKLNPSADELENVLLNALEAACCASEAGFEAATVALAASSAANATHKLKVARQKRLHASKQKKSGYLSPIKIISREYRENFKPDEVITQQVWSRVDKNPQTIQDISKEGIEAWEQVRTQMRKSDAYVAAGLSPSQPEPVRTPPRDRSSPSFTPASPIYNFDGDSNADAKIVAQSASDFAPTSSQSKACRLQMQIQSGNDGGGSGSGGSGDGGSSSSSSSASARRPSATVRRVSVSGVSIRELTQAKAEVEVSSPVYLATARPRHSVTSKAKSSSLQQQQEVGSPAGVRKACRVSVVSATSMSTNANTKASPAPAPAPTPAPARGARRRATVTAVLNLSSSSDPDFRQPISPRRHSAIHYDRRGSEWKVTPELFDLQSAANEVVPMSITEGEEEAEYI